MSTSRQAEILKHLAANGCAGFGNIRRSVNRSMGDHHPKKIFEIDMKQLCFDRGLVQLVPDRSGRVIFSFTRLGELIYGSPSKVMRSVEHKKKPSRQLAMA